MHDIYFRKIEPEDLVTLAKIEKAGHQAIDADFQVPISSPYAWNATDIQEVLDEEYCRGFVIEEGDENIVGYYIYEIEEETYRLSRLIVHPQYRRAQIGWSVIHKMHTRLDKSKLRKTLVASVRENDLATCEWMARVGFTSRLIRHGWSETMDAIEFSFTSREFADDENATQKGEVG